MMDYKTHKEELLKDKGCQGRDGKVTFPTPAHPRGTQALPFM